MIYFRVRKWIMLPGRNPSVGLQGGGYGGKVDATILGVVKM